MEENKRNIDEFFRKELGTATEGPPSSVWDNLEKRLEYKPGPKITGWWFYLLLALIFMGGSLAAYYVTRPDSALPVKADPASDHSSMSYSPSISASSSENVENTSPIAPPASVNPVTNETNRPTTATTHTPLSATDEKTAPKSMATHTLPGHGEKEAHADESPEMTMQQADADEKVSVAPIPGRKGTAGKRWGNKQPGSSQKSVAKNGAATVAPASGSQPDNTLGKRLDKTPAEGLLQSSSKSKVTSGPASKVSGTTQDTENGKTRKRTDAEPAHKEEAADQTKQTTTAVAKPSRPVKPAQPSLSGTPSDVEDDEEPVNETSKEKEEDIAAPVEPEKENLNRNVNQQAEKIVQARSANPLAGTPVAENEREEAERNNAGIVTPQVSASGGSGNGTKANGEKVKDRKPLNMAIGIKAAYEGGFKDYTANKFIASVFGEVNFTPKLSFIVQPGIKMARTNQEYSRAGGTYYQAGDIIGTLYNIHRDTIGMPTGYNDYAYSQTYDSIVASVMAKRKFIEIEIPFLFRYKVDKNLSFLGGMNFTFGKIMGTESALKTISGLRITDTLLNFYSPSGDVPPPSSKFSHTGSDPFSTYKDPGSSDPINPVRFGYTAGLSYTARQRLMVDLTIQQNLSGLNNINDKEIRKLFSQPYVRLSLGFVLVGRKK